MKIAIDGPAGAGKSTVARMLARRLGYVYIDTGAMYRALAHKAIMLGISPHDENALFLLAQVTDIRFLPTPGQIQRVCCDGQDVSDQIRSPEVSQAVGIVAAHTRVREIMVESQKTLASGGDVIMDGRDIGEVVIPDADFKFFLTADLRERARRRQVEWAGAGQERPGEEVLAEIIDRDYGDSHREYGALKELADSIRIDTTSLEIEQVEKLMLGYIRGS